MGVYLDPGFKKFEMTVKSQIYVDKTNLIEETDRVLGRTTLSMCQPTTAFWQIRYCAYAGCLLLQRC